MEEERIVCFRCSKLFAVKKHGCVLVTPSTQIEFLKRDISEDETQIEILCSKCKAYTTIIFD